MNILTSRKTWAALAIGLACTVGHTQEFRIGFVSIDRIFRDSAPAKAAQTKLEQEFSKREKELDDLAAQLKTATEKLDRESVTLPEAQRTTRQRQIADQDREFQRRRREFQEDLGVRKNEELQQVIERANRVIRQVAEAEKFDLVIQEAVYINPKHDMTEKVLKVINSGK
jgi:outer membrane protein